MERRTFLALGAAAVGLAGCTRESSDPKAPSTPPVQPAPRDPDARLRDAVGASEVALIAAYRSAMAGHPELAPALEPFLGHHEQHLARVAPGFATSVDSRPPSPSASPSASTSSSTSDEPTGSADSGPNESPRPPAGNALAELAEAESAAQAQRATACDGASDPALARDLCLIAASEAQHAAVLDVLVARASES